MIDKDNTNANDLRKRIAPDDSKTAELKETIQTTAEHYGLKADFIVSDGGLCTTLRFSSGDVNAPVTDPIWFSSVRAGNGSEFELFRTDKNTVIAGLMDLIQEPKNVSFRGKLCKIYAAVNPEPKREFVKTGEIWKPRSNADKEKERENMEK